MPTTLSKNIVVALHQVQPPPSDLVLPPIFYYQPKNIFVLNRTMFAKALATAPHLFSNGLFGMINEHLSGCFTPKDPSVSFSKLLQVVTTIVCRDIFRSMALMLGVNKLLVMAKNIGGLCPIAMGEVFF